MTTTQETSGNTFDNLGIAPKLLEVLLRHKYTVPTPIQAQSIPPAIEGKDIMGIAQTGTGKTLAFGIPMIQRIARNSGQTKGLVILPTRELAVQVDETLKKIGTSLGLRTALLMGGENMHRQVRALKQNPHIIIATPGRLIDHIETKRLGLENVSVLVLDEADRMLDMGFAPQINKILQRVPKNRQTMLFSATMPHEIVKIAHSYMQTPLRVEVAPAGTSSANVTQEVIFLDRNDKLDMLQTVLKKYDKSVLIFTRTKHGAAKIARVLKQMNYTAAEIHSNRSLNQRLGALSGFKTGKFRVLVATDIAARGIDVTGIQLVLNYDLPATAEDYVHRIGRTGRAGMTGHAISFAQFDQRRDVKAIERLIKKNLVVGEAKFERQPMTEQMREAMRDSGIRDSRSPRRDFGGPRNSPRGDFKRGPRPPFGRGNDRGGDRQTRRVEQKAAYEAGAFVENSIRTSGVTPPRTVGGAAPRAPYNNPRPNRDAKPFERKPYGAKPFNSKPYGAKPFGSRDGKPFVSRDGKPAGARGGNFKGKDRRRSSKDRHVFPHRKPGFPQESVGYFIERPRTQGDD